MKPKILVILGPTASGKSDLAVKMAQKFNGEIISADSRQVYKNLNIGSGKITKEEMLGVPHYLLDVCDPKEIFNVDQYKKLAEESIQNILKKEKLPIVCGGTGFYIDALVSGISLPEVPPNEKLRKEIENLNEKELFERLQKIDPKRAEDIDSKNKVRLIRAIEIAEALGKVPEINKDEKYNTLYIGIDWQKEELKKRIFSRLISRIENGMIEEVKDLHNNGLSYERMYELGLEYRYVSMYLQEKISKEEMIEKLNTEIWHYAKRQMTWFKRNKNIIWIKPEALFEAEKAIENFVI